MVFPSKVDLWLALVLAAAWLFTLFAAHEAWQSAHTWFGFIPSVLMAALVLLLAVPMRYELHDNELLVRSGVIRYHIPYAAITSVRPSRALWTSPAWSLDRIAVESRVWPSPLYISPKDKLRFMEELKRRIDNRTKQQGDLW